MLYQQYLELAKRLHGMHGLLLPTSLTIDSLHMRRLEHWAIFMYKKKCGAHSFNEARTFMFTPSLKSLDSTTTTPPHPRHNMLRLPCSLQLLYGSSKKNPQIYQYPVNGAGNGIPEPNSAITNRTGQTWQISAMYARCPSTVDV